MGTTDIWPTVHAERQALAADLRDLSAGSGPELSDPIVSLVMAMTGRKAAIDDLTGEGAATLRSRS